MKTKLEIIVTIFDLDFYDYSGSQAGWITVSQQYAITCEPSKQWNWHRNIYCGLDDKFSWAIQVSKSSKLKTYMTNTKMKLISITSMGDILAPVWVALSRKLDRVMDRVTIQASPNRNPATNLGLLITGLHQRVRAREATEGPQRSERWRSKEACRD